jgi:TetR/AcrR family transcriptional regulator, tetracycline repressor protein
MATTRTTLTKHRILELALDIIDREGLPALNMRRLAAEAGVKPMSLYHHFQNKDAILNGVAECIAATALGDAGARPHVPSPAPGGDWKRSARLLFVGLYELVQAHPRALPLISTGVLRTPSGRRWMEELMGVLLDAGFTPDEAAELYHTVGGFTLGLGYAGLLSLEVPATQIVTELAGHWNDYPSLLAVGLRLARWDRADEFATGLDTLLEHYAGQLAAGREGSEETRGPDPGARRGRR